jgi:hypothetical protein
VTLRTAGQLAAIMALSHMVADRDLAPQRWTAANDAKRPPSGKDRSKIKAARKQKVKRK